MDGPATTSVWLALLLCSAVSACLGPGSKPPVEDPPDPIISPEIAIPPVTNGQQKTPTIASDGNDFLVGWAESGATAIDDAYVVAMTATGEVLTPVGIPVSSAAAAKSKPRLAWGRDNYLAVWNQAADGAAVLSPIIHGSRVSAQGSVLDGAGFSVSATEPRGGSALAHGGSDYLVAWYDYGGLGLATTRVSEAGGTMDGGTHAFGLAPAILDPTLAAAFGGTSYLVVGINDMSLSGLLVSAESPQAGPTWITLPRTEVDTSGSVYPSAAAVAWDGDNFFVVWECVPPDHPFQPFAGICGTRVDASGQVLPPSRIAVSTPGNCRSPTITWDGGQFLVAWKAIPAGSSYFGIFAARVTPTGEVIDADPILVSDAPMESLPRTMQLAAAGPGHFALVYERFDATPSVERYRVFARTIGF